MKKKKVILGLIVFIMMIIFLGCSTNDKSSPVAKNGVLDLSNWDFNKESSVVNLNGQWFFYWNRLLQPSDIKNDEEQKAQLVNVPSTWDKYTINSEKLSQYGYGTYELKIKVKDISKTYSMKLPNEGGAYNLWIDGELLASNGVVGQTSKETTPCPISKTVCFKPNGQEVTVVFQMSNFNYRMSGIVNPICIGNMDQIQRINYISIARNLIFTGAIFIIALYNIIVYRKDKAALYFGFGCLGLAIRNLFYGEYFILYILPKLSWIIVLKVEYLSFYITFTFFVAYIYYFFPGELKRIFLRINVIICTVFSLIVIVSPAQLFTPMLIIYQLFSIMSAIYIIVGVIKAIRNKRENAIHLTLGGIIFLITVLNDVLYNNKIINTIELSSLGIVIFICIQFVAFSKKYSEVFRKAKAYEWEKDKLKISEIMRNVTTVLTSTLELSEIINKILDQLQLLVTYDSAVLILIYGGRAKIAALKGYDDEQNILNKEYPLEDMPLLKKIIESEKGVIIDNIKASEEKIRFVGNEKILSWIGVPIFQGGEVIGALSIQSVEENKYSKAEWDIIYSFAAQVGMAIRNAKLYTEVKQLAMYDGLTGLYNRRVFFEIIEKEYRRAVRYNFPFSVIMVDIDNFKQINDVYGHNIGDRVLKTFASEIKGMLRETDIIGRYGGEEFIIVTNVNKENSVLLAERLRNHLENYVIRTEEQGEFSITASFGVAQLSGEKQPLIDLIILSDKALYDAKNSGRNKVCSR